MKILIVSGGPRVTSQITTALLGEDFTYVEVRTPQRALKVLEEDASFDLVLADCDTHPTGGFFLAREVRLREADGADLPPVVLLVSRPQDEYLARWAEADAWIVKPVDAFDLAEVIEALIDRSPVPALPGVTSLNADGSLTAPGRPPLSAGADFRVWAGDADEQKSGEEEQEGSAAAHVEGGDEPQQLPPTAERRR